MSIYFRNTPVSAPFMFESLGNHWNQDNISRPDGYPYLLSPDGKRYRTYRSPRETIYPGCKRGDSHHTISSPLLSPGIHLNRITICLFTGLLAGSIPSMTDNQEVILTPKEQGLNIRKLISYSLRKYHQPTLVMKSLSSDCYNLLMNFMDCAASPKNPG